MPPRRRPTFTAESIDQQLQQIHLLDTSSPSENLEQLGPIIKQIYSSRHEEAYLRTLKTLTEEKDSEIERICGDNYQDFVSSVSTLLTVRQYTHNLQDKISTLDGSVSSVGKALLAKKKELLELKKTAANLDETVDALQSCIKVLDVVQRVGDMISQANYWSALRSLEDIQNMSPTNLSQTPFFLHLLSAVPSLRAQIKDAVIASNKSWLLEIRNISGKVGKYALETMETRCRRWRLRQDKDPTLRSSRVGSAVEIASNEGKEVDALDNTKVHVEFKPLYQSIHIYTALDSLEDLQKSYHADRKAQSTLILPTKLTLPALPNLLQEIAGFFIIETHVLRSTRNFRSEREVEELWDEALRRVNEGVKDALATETDTDLFVEVKELVISFSMTMEGHGYTTQSLHDALSSLLKQYVALLRVQIGDAVEKLIDADELVPAKFTSAEEKEIILQNVWLTTGEMQDVSQFPISQGVPWSASFNGTCEKLRMFIMQFYKFIEGISQHQRESEDTLEKSLDKLLTEKISGTYIRRVNTTSVLSQAAQVITDLYYFQSACNELEMSASELGTLSRGDSIKLQNFRSSLSEARKITGDRINAVIQSKLNVIFELSEYDWTPRSREKEGSPSTYLYELVNWLTTVVDSLPLKGEARDQIYAQAVHYVADNLMDLLLDINLPMLNENALANLLIDVDFLVSQLSDIGRSQLSDAFVELKDTVSIALQDRVGEYLNISLRQTVFSSVKPKRLSTILDKLSKYSVEKGKREPSERERGERRRKESDAVGRIYPGESR